MLARAVAVLAIAAGAAFVPAGAAYAEETCVTVPWEFQYPFACRDSDYPTCVVYGSLGEEGRFHLGDCPWPW